MVSYHQQSYLQKMSNKSNNDHTCTSESRNKFNNFKDYFNQTDEIECRVSAGIAHSIRRSGSITRKIMFEGVKLDNKSKMPTRLVFWALFWREGESREASLQNFPVQFIFIYFLTPRGKIRCDFFELFLENFS